LSCCVVNSASCGSRQEVNDGLLQKQFQLLTSALTDSAPAVRAAAAGGVCGLLDRYWELMPHATVAAYLQRLCGAALRSGA
jgi:condensin-2 complex subunit G2